MFLACWFCTRHSEQLQDHADSETLLCVEKRCWALHTTIWMVTRCTSSLTDMYRGQHRDGREFEAHWPGQQTHWQTDKLLMRCMNVMLAGRLCRPPPKATWHSGCPPKTAAGHHFGRAEPTSINAWWQPTVSQRRCWILDVACAGLFSKTLWERGSHLFAHMVVASLVCHCAGHTLVPQHIHRQIISRRYTRSLKEVAFRHCAACGHSCTCPYSASRASCWPDHVHNASHCLW